MKYLLGLVTIVLVVFGAWLYLTQVGKTQTQPAQQAPEETRTATTTNQISTTTPMYVTLKTNEGDIKIQLLADKAPNTVANFVKLAGEGFYDGVKFHRVIQGFMIQGGDPLSKDDSMVARWGTGGPGYTFADELPQAGEYKIGSVAMANSGPDTNGSQFFIVTGQDGVGLPPNYSLFGQVVEGMDAVTNIEDTPTDANDRPVDPQVIESTVVE